MREVTGAARAFATGPTGGDWAGEPGRRARPVRIEVAPRALVALLLVGGGLWMAIRLWPVLSVGPAVLAAFPRGPVIAVVVLVLMVAYEELESRVLIPRIYGRALRLPSSVVLFALLAGGTLMGIVGALLALPVAATVMMLLAELRVELPGEQESPRDASLREGDDRAEEEYERRTHGVRAVRAAGIAAEITLDRREEEKSPPEGDERTAPARFAD